ncbi:putative transposase [Shigella sonnei str. Moseley]|nr:putative transposase [Shigella sonnei str. Moseley]
MLPRFADIFQQGNRWLNWLEKQPEGAVRPVVIESVTKIMACGTTLMGYTQWCCSSPDCCHTKKVCFRCKSRSCPHVRGEGWRTVDTVSAEPGPRLPVAAYCVHTSLPVLVPGVPQPVVTDRDEPHCSGCDTGNLPSGRCGVGDIHGDPHMGA